MREPALAPLHRIVILHAALHHPDLFQQIFHLIPGLDKIDIVGLNDQEGGIVIIEKRFPSTQINKLKGTFPRAIEVITVPEATVTGATPIIRAPSTKSGEVLKK